MIASFVKFTSTAKTAICMVKKTKFSLSGGQPVYLNGDAVREELGDTPKKGDTLTLPEDTVLVPMMVRDEETEEFVEATTKDGKHVLMTIE